MARIVYHEHPRQAGRCLKGAFAEYLQRIPVPAGVRLEKVWVGIRIRPYLEDLGGAWGAQVIASCGVPLERKSQGDRRCTPVQRSRVWPSTMNCWEATAHFVACALSHLGSGWTVHVWDRDLPNGARHMWPSLLSPRGDHLLVDLQSVVPRQYPPRIYSGVYQGNQRR